MFDDIFNDVQDAVQEATSTASSTWSDVTSGIWDGMQSGVAQAGQAAEDLCETIDCGAENLFGNAFGGGVQADLPNPLRFAENVASKVGQIAVRTAETVGDVAENAWMTLENIPGLSIGGEGQLEVNGHKIGTEGGFNVPNPLRSIREGIQDGVSNTILIGEEIAEQIGETCEDVYTGLENIPDLDLGAHVGVEINGKDYDLSTPDVHLHNPLKDLRKGATKTGREIAEQTRRLHDKLVSLPGLSLFGEGEVSGEDQQVNSDQTVGYDNYNGNDPRLDVYGGRRHA